MHACLELEASEPRWIRLTARVANGTLVINVENPCAPQAKQRKRHGSTAGKTAKGGIGSVDGLSAQTKNARLGEQDGHGASPQDESLRDTPAPGLGTKPVAMPEHGWGLSIVDAIARRHGGDAQTDARDGVFALSVVLLLEGGRP